MNENVYMLVISTGVASFENLVPGRVFTKAQMEDPMTQALINNAKLQYPKTFKIMTLTTGPVY